MATNARVTSLTEKTTPVDADDFLIEDSVADETKKIGWDNLKAAVLTYIKSQLGVGVTDEAMGGSGANRTIAHTPISGTLMVFDGAVKLTLNDDYTVSATAVTFTVAPSDPRAYYRYDST